MGWALVPPCRDTAAAALSARQRLRCVSKRFFDVFGTLCSTSQSPPWPAFLPVHLRECVEAVSLEAVCLEALCLEAVCPEAVRGGGACECGHMYEHRSSCLPAAKLLQISAVAPSSSQRFRCVSKRFLTFSGPLFAPAAKVSPWLALAPRCRSSCGFQGKLLPCKKRHAQHIARVVNVSLQRFWRFLPPTFFEVFRNQRF